MFIRKNNPHNSLKFKKRKMFPKDLPQRALKTNINRWIFMLIFLLITFGIIVLFLISVNNYVRIIIGYSLTGFLTFFMGYFGWVLAEAVIDKITFNNDQKNANGVLYYFRKLRKNNEQ